MTRNIQNVVDDLNELVSSIGLEKLAQGVVADPGTSQPAEQEASRSNIAPATEGAQAAENSAMVREDVTGQSIDEASPAAAEGGEISASSPEKITTATTVGDDPSVEKDYGSRQETLNAPGTSHPADVNKDSEKYSSANLKDSAGFILHEVALQKQASVADLTEENAIEKLGRMVLTASDEDGMNKTAEEASSVGVAATSEFLTGYVKTASLVGELTADYIDGLIVGAVQKEAMDGEELPPELMAAEEAGAVDAGGGEEEAAAEALVQEAVMIAEELGVSPEEVLEAALAEAEQGDVAEDMGEAAPVSEEELMAGVADEAAAQEAGGEAIPEENMEVIASWKGLKDAYKARSAAKTAIKAHKATGKHAAGRIGVEADKVLATKAMKGEAIDTAKTVGKAVAKPAAIAGAAGAVGAAGYAAGKSSKKKKDDDKEKKAELLVKAAALSAAWKHGKNILGQMKGVATSAAKGNKLTQGLHASELSAAIPKFVGEAGQSLATAKGVAKTVGKVGGGAAALGGAAYAGSKLGGGGDEEKAAEAIDAEIAEMAEKASEYDKLMAEKAASEKVAENAEVIATAVNSAMEAWWVKKSAEIN